MTTKDLKRLEAFYRECAERLREAEDADTEPHESQGDSEGVETP